MATLIGMLRGVRVMHIYRVRPLARVYDSLDPSTGLPQAATARAEVAARMTSIRVDSPSQAA